ncbi:shadow of prion protein [Acipenser oxyrinchus oxyrinchus]|uniref:Shadow of prion protein n=1 Tax=Acipenser oxyrinchus oxyrinchus TaxID=40147 RepID=A0AAD8DB33_ACIOX|nr:shadow of prion protein [Acipenser oxyrinchus oxyrinchus]
MNRTTATCWMVMLLAAFFCETVISKGGRGGARGAAWGAARGMRSRVKATRYRSSGSTLRMAAGGAAADVVAGRWLASFRYRSDDSSKMYGRQYGNRRDGDYSYSAGTSSSVQTRCSFTTITSALCLISVFKYVSV